MRRYIDENDKKNEIRLLFKHPSYKDKIIIVVEGNSDIKLFRKLIQHKRIKIESIDGKKDLIKVMKALSVEFPEKILGICDADFDHLIGEIPDERRKYSVYVTDEHDIEMMMLLSPALESFYHEFSTSENIEELKKNTFKHALDAAFFIGNVRWINTEYNLNLNFKGMNYREFIDVNKIEVHIHKNSFIDILINRSPSVSSSVDKKLIYDLIESKEDKSGHIYQICCGHDITNIIALVYSQKWASVDVNMNFKKVETSLRLGYQLTDFHKTLLYKNIDEKLRSFNIHLTIAEEIPLEAESAVI